MLHIQGSGCLGWHVAGTALAHGSDGTMTACGLEQPMPFLQRVVLHRSCKSQVAEQLAAAATAAMQVPPSTAAMESETSQAGDSRPHVQHKVPNEFRSNGPGTCENELQSISQINEIISIAGRLMRRTSPRWPRSWCLSLCLSSGRSCCPSMPFMSLSRTTT